MLLFVDNIFRFTQAGSEVSALLGRMPSAVGYQPTLATEMGDLQERITSTTTGSITSVQAVYVPADDLTDPARPRRSPTSTPRRFCPVRSPSWASTRPSTRWSPPPARSSRNRGRGALSRGHRIQELLQNYKDLQDIIAILGMDELSEEQKSACLARVRLQQFFGQCFHVATQFTGLPGKYVKMEDTVRSFAAILDGECDEDSPSSASA